MTIFRRVQTPSYSVHILLPSLLPSFLLITLFYSVNLTLLSPLYDTLLIGVYSSLTKGGGEGPGGEGVECWDGVVRRVVIGVPANSSEKKKEATRRAARTAGFEDVRTFSHMS